MSIYWDPETSPRPSCTYCGGTPADEELGCRLPQKTARKIGIKDGYPRFLCFPLCVPCFVEAVGISVEDLGSHPPANDGGKPISQSDIEAVKAMWNSPPINFDLRAIARIEELGKIPRGFTLELDSWLPRNG